MSRTDLSLQVEEMRTAGYQVVDQVVDYLNGLADGPAVTRPPVSGHELNLQEEPQPIGVAISEVVDLILSDTMHVQHPRFFAFVPSPGNFVSALADLLASGFNIFAGTWIEAPGPARLEIATLRWLCDLVGLPDKSSGLFVSGGSVANLIALAAARNGSSANKPVLYLSDQTHSSVLRGAKIIGLQDSQIRILDTDPSYRLRPDSVSAAIKEDRKAGKTPFCVVANAGTINTGAVDPLLELAELTHDTEIWLHVDAAYGGGAMLHPEGREILEGIERADSVTLDPHKWLFQPFECGCLLVRDPKRLEAAFRIVPDYLQDVVTDDSRVNFCDRGIQLTRRFNALKLWLSLRVFGVNAFRSAIHQGFESARYFERQLRRRSEWTIVTPPRLAIVVFRWEPEGVDSSRTERINRELVNRVSRNGSMMVSSTILRDQTVIRACTINPRTTTNDIASVVQQLTEIAETISK